MTKTSASDGRPELRILVLFGNTPLLGNERANIETIRQLRDQGASVLFLIRSDWTENLQRELNRLALPFRFVPYYDRLRFGASLKEWVNNVRALLVAPVLLLWIAFRWRATHIHVGSTAWVINFLPALALLKTPLVFRAGDVPPQHHALWRWTWKYTARRASAFVCDSRFIREKVIALGAPPERCDVVYAPAPARSNIPKVKLHYCNPDCLTIICVGQISREKGIETLIYAVSDLADRYKLQLIIAGDHKYSSYGSKMVRLVAELGLIDKIVFTGFVEDIDAVYMKSDLHIAPSIWEEPYGLTVLEAKSRGIPSIVFPSGGLPELIAHGEDGWLCDAPNKLALSTAIEAYLRDPISLRRHGDLAHRSLTERLRVQEFGCRWRSIYEQTIN